MGEHLTRRVRRGQFGDAHVLCCRLCLSSRAGPLCGCVCLGSFQRLRSGCQLFCALDCAFGAILGGGIRQDVPGVLAAKVAARRTHSPIFCPSLGAGEAHINYSFWCCVAWNQTKLNGKAQPKQNLVAQRKPNWCDIAVQNWNRHASSVWKGNGVSLESSPIHLPGSNVPLLPRQDLHRSQLCPTSDSVRPNSF